MPKSADFLISMLRELVDRVLTFYTYDRCSAGVESGRVHDIFDGIVGLFEIMGL